MHYYHMTSEEIPTHSTKYLLYLYEEYPKRVGEYMGIFDKCENEKENTLNEDDYPEFLNDPDEANKLIEEFNKINK